MIHVHHLAGHSAGLLRVAARRKIPVVYQVQDWWAPCARVNLFDAWRHLCSGPAAGKCAACRPLTSLPPAPVLNRLLHAYRLRRFRRSLRTAEAFVMGSRFILDSYLELGVLDRDSLVFVIPYGVELEPRPHPPARPARPPGSPLRFGVMGSILPHKGIHVAVQAFAGIEPSRATLTVWGDPAIDPAYTRELEALRGPGTEIRERFEDDCKAEVFAGLDALLVPSLGLESFGLVAREAMHHGVPVLAARRGALPEMFLGGDFGALFNPEDPADLRGWIERLIADPGILDRWLEHLPAVKGMEQHTEEIEEVYEKVLAEKILLDRTLTGKLSRKKGEVAGDVEEEAPLTRALRVAARVLRSEGGRAVRDRALDRLAEARRRRSFTNSPLPQVPIPVLNLATAAPAARLGGVQVQLLHRLEAEAALRPVALLYPDAAGHRLEVVAGGARWALQLSGSFERAVAAAAERVGATALHVEGLAGLSMESLLALRRRGLRLILALHDFSPFCPRPHLLEHPALRFCHYSRDMERCAACLRQDWPVNGAWQARHRELAAELLAESEALVFPSDFLRRTYRDLFPALSPDRQHLIPPAAAWKLVPPRPSPGGPIRHVALVGGVQVYKGALVFEEVVRRLADRQDLRWSAYGGGDAALLERLRRLPRMDVRGYYRSGSLPALLRRDRVDLALLLSIVPETYSLVLTECQAAGLPVLAFDLGAPADRLRQEGGGLTVPLEAGDEGVAALLCDVLAGGAALPPLSGAPEPTARRVAESWLRLYRALAVEGRPPGPPFVGGSPG